MPVRDEQRRQYVEYVTSRMPELCRLARSLCGDWDRADDVVQETITTLYVRWRRARAADDIDRYVRRMLVNTFLADRRKAWHRRTHLVAEPPDRATPDAAAFEGWDRVVAAALRRVPPRQRAAVVLRFSYELPVAEVADLLGCSEGTVKSQTSRGLVTLRRLLTENPAVATE